VPQNRVFAVENPVFSYFPSRTFFFTRSIQVKAKDVRGGRTQVSNAKLGFFLTCQMEKHLLPPFSSAAPPIKPT
jgi:hypothetical protein